MISDINCVHAELRGGESSAAQIIYSKDRSFPGPEIFFSKEIKFNIFGNGKIT